MKKLIFILILFIFGKITNAQSLSISGEWNFTIPSSDITEAGEDFSGEYESNVNQVFIDVSHNGKWKVSIGKNDIDWNNDIGLYAKRTGDGLGSKKINGGKNYKNIRNKSNNFFQGDRDRLYIPIQYKIDKVSVLIPAHTYIVEIVYTLQAK